MDVEGDARDKYACTLDKLAYGGTFDTWVAIANDKEYNGIVNQNSLFTPSKVRRNQNVIESGLDKTDLTPIMKTDVMDKSMLSAKKATVESKSINNKPSVSKSDIKALENKIQTNASDIECNSGEINPGDLGE